MKLRDTIGQLFILGFRGNRLDMQSEIYRDISKRNLGGVILFDNFITGNADNTNVISKEQLTTLCQDLQKCAPSKLLISIDQEGGKVRRLKQKHGFPELPSAAEMGSRNDLSLSKHFAFETGRLLTEIGINCNFAPVADVNTNNSSPVIGALGRSFSEDPHEVVKHCRVWLQGLQQSGILGCLKHFPGHGSAAVDSHKGFVDISSTWQPLELNPYEQIIASGEVRAIMMGHLYHQGFDDTYPASLSKKIIGTMLRRKLGFDGLVITDDLQMRAITDKYGLCDAVVRALAAGVDLVIIGNNLQNEPEIMGKAVNAVIEAVDAGVLSEDSLLQSYRRVTRTKEILT